MGSTPNIRFNGYRDDWEQHALGELYTERNERGNDSLQILSVSIHSGVSDGELDEENLGKVVRRSEDKSTYKHVYEGDLIFNMMRAWQGAIGVAKSEGMISPAYISAIPCKNLYPPFMNYLLRREETIGQINNLSYGITDFRKRLYWDSFVKVVCNVPSTSEQKRIASFFESLDALIILHQDKFNHAQKLKKYMLQKMFPQKDQSVPEIRFAGFTDAWEQRKLGDVAESYSGGTPSVGNKSYYGGSIPFIRSAEINSESTELFLTEEGLSNSSARMVSEGDILYALYGATSGEVGRSRINGAINQAILAIVPHDGYDSEFLMQWLRKSKQSITDVYLQGGQGNLSGAIVKALEVDFPSLKEQQQIGNYLQSLDHLITLHQRKCDELAELKKYMLQNMFPKKEG